MATEAGYGLIFDDLNVTIDEAHLEGPEESGAGDSGAGGHCHGDHCHGAAPSEGTALDAGAGGAGGVLYAAEPVATVIVGGPAATLSFEPASMGRGAVVELAVEVDAVAFDALVFDLTDQGRLPASGQRFRLEAHLHTPVHKDLSLVFDHGHPLEVTLQGSLSLPTAIFDGVDFGAAPDGETIADALIQGVLAHGLLTIDVVR